MRDVEADVRTDLMCIRIVLNESVKKRARRESIGETKSDEVRSERAVDQRYVVAAISEVQIQMVVCFQNHFAIKGLLTSAPELAPSVAGTSAQPLAWAGPKAWGVLQVGIAAGSNRNVRANREWLQEAVIGLE